MSRAFVKEPDGDQAEEDLPERPQSDHPNYITVAGLARLNERIEALRARAQALQAAGDALSARNELSSLRAELRYLEKRATAAIPVDPAVQAGDGIRFGATVEMEDETGQRHVFTVVGEDEAEPTQGRISWVSPLGQALLNRRVGDTVIWKRPAGDLEMEILSVRYQ